MVLEDTPRIPAYRYPEALWLQAYNRAGLASAMRSHTNLLLNNKS
jgi:hypothetical protein